jgi:ribosomal 50S subunit-recycling heat shock protein
MPEPAAEPISVRARFERFPATVKGAFIFRGEDPDPHQVVVAGARVSALGPGGSSPMPLAPVTLDVVPHRDVFVPFELPLSDLEPGWYTLVCDVEVDGSPATFDGGRRFSVPWPRATVRRGQVKIGKRVRLGEQTVEVEQVECSGDSIKVSMRVEPPGVITLKLLADGRRLQVLETEEDEDRGRVKATAYPLLRADEVLRIELKGRGKGAEDAIEVVLA